MKEKKRSQKYKKYKEIENFLRDIFLAKKKKKDTKLSGFWRLREKNFGKKKKIYIRGVKMHI